jgi:hypothetical protein|tara:strand:+ start:263 stop:691 length:429 start_codon:yes stop_codon:yes gene_type:complete
MAVKQSGRKQYATMQGKKVDMDLLRQRNELTPAVGNARVNARGDELGPGGKIIKKREDVLGEYYRDHPQAVPDEVPGHGVAPQDAEAQPIIDKVAKESKPAPVKKATKSALEKEMADIDSEAVETGTEWVEDTDGNFVKKGD